MSKIILLPYQLPPIAIRALGSTASDRFTGIAMNSVRNIYVSGHTDSAGAGGRDAVIAKYDRIGNLLWHRFLGGTGADQGQSIAVDSSNNVYLYGQTDSEGQGGIDLFLAKYDDSGTLLWQRILGSASNLEGGTQVATFGSDAVYICGNTDSNSQGDRDFLVAKYNGSGTLQWQKILGNASKNVAYGLTVDPSGNVIVSGGADTLSVTGPAYIIKYDSGGNLLWQKSYSGPGGNDVFYEVTTDSSGNIYCTGALWDVGVSKYQGITLKLDSSGNIVWQRLLQAGATGTILLSGISVDNSGDVYATGYWDPVGAEPTDFQLVKYNNSGAIQWQRTMNGAPATPDTGFQGIVTASGINAVYQIGDTGSVGFGDRDGLLLRVPKDGTAMGSYPPFTYQASSLTDSAGTMVAATSSLTQGSPGLVGAVSTLTDQPGSLNVTVVI